MTRRLADIVDLDDQRDIATLDYVLATGKIVRHHGYMLVPDVALIEGFANGKPPPPLTRRIRRADGRSVSVFAMPTTVGRQP